MIAISEIEITGRHRKDVGDLTDLCRSIEQIGLLHPVVVDSSNRLIAGRRRIAAFKKLGRESIPAHVAKNFDDAVQFLVAERDENTCRKDFAISEAVALGNALEKLERPKAKERQGTRTDKHPEKFTEGVMGETREKVGAAIGMSGPIYQRAKSVVKAAAENPKKFAAVLEEMDRTGKVTPAYVKIGGFSKEKKNKERVRAPVSALAVRAAAASLDQLVGALERIQLASRVASHISAIRKEIENAKN